jgi:hypothetical protein
MKKTTVENAKYKIQYEDNNGLARWAVYELPAHSAYASAQQRKLDWDYIGGMIICDQLDEYYIAQAKNLIQQKMKLNNPDKYDLKKEVLYFV